MLDGQDYNVIKIVRTEPLVMTVSTTVVVTVWEIPRVTNRLVTVTGVANQDILTTTVVKCVHLDISELIVSNAVVVIVLLTNTANMSVECALMVVKTDILEINVMTLVKRDILAQTVLGFVHKTVELTPVATRMESVLVPQDGRVMIVPENVCHPMEKIASIHAMFIV